MSDKHTQGLPLSRTQRTITREVAAAQDAHRASLKRIKHLVTSAGLFISASSTDTLTRAIDAELERLK